MMIAARLAGGNLFLPFLGGGFWEHSEQLGALGFFEGILWWGILGAARIFLRGFFFLGVVVGCVLDCKCWKKIKK